LEITYYPTYILGFGNIHTAMDRSVFVSKAGRRGVKLNRDTAALKALPCGRIHKYATILWNII